MNKCYIVLSNGMMRFKIAILLLSCVLSSCLVSCTNEEADKLLLSDTVQITYSIGEQSPRNWIVFPDASPDILSVEVPKDRTIPVKFVTPIDSLEFPLGLADTLAFDIVVNGDTANTQVI